MKSLTAQAKPNEVNLQNRQGTPTQLKESRNTSEGYNAHKYRSSPRPFRRSSKVTHSDCDIDACNQPWLSSAPEWPRSAQAQGATQLDSVHQLLTAPGRASSPSPGRPPRGHPPTTASGGRTPTWASRPTAPPMRRSGATSIPLGDVNDASRSVT